VCDSDLEINFQNLKLQSQGPMKKSTCELNPD
jgi:hypothetical protein